MMDDRLTVDLADWLHDGDIASPDPRLSAARAMTVIDATEQLGRWWPPARLAHRVGPAPALGSARLAPAAHPRPWPSGTRGGLPTITAVRLLVAAAAFALASGGLLVASSMEDETTDLATLTSPAPSTAVLTPIPTDRSSPEPELEATSAESTFAATRVITPLGPDADPASLGPGSQGRSVFVDRAAERVHEVGSDGYLRTIARSGDAGWDTAVGSPMLAVGGGKDIVFFDAGGRGWRWVELGSPGYLTRLDAASKDRAVASIDPATRIFDSVSHGRREYDVYLAEPGSGDIVRYEMRLPDEQFAEADERVQRDALGDAIDIYLDPTLFVLGEGGVERYVDGIRDAGFVLEDPPGGLPDYRYIDGIGRDGKGQLWLFDARGHRMVAFDKRDGRYVGSWAPGPAGLVMSDVRGMYVDGDGRGSVAAVTWMTPAGLVRSALADPTVLEPASESGTLDALDRGAGPRAIDWQDRGLRMEADAIDLRIGRQGFTMPGEALPEGSASSDEGELGIHWYERGIQQRLFFLLVADDSHWWVSEIWTYDGVKVDGGWLYYEDLAGLTRTPLGESLEGDLRLRSTGADRSRFQKHGTGRLRIDGLRLTAFTPGSRPAPLTTCDPIDDSRITANSYPLDALQGPGEPLEGIRDLSPTDAEALLRDTGLCYRFDYRWRVPRVFENAQLQKHVGWSGERRCSAPDTGRIDAITFGRDYPYEDASRLIVYVSVVDRKIRDRPDVPPEGTDCPSS